MRTRAQKAYLAVGLLFMAGGTVMVALANESIGAIIAGAGIVALSAICFYNSGEEDGKHQEPQDAEHKVN